MNISFTHQIEPHHLDVQVGVSLAFSNKLNLLPVMFLDNSNSRTVINLRLVETTYDVLTQRTRKDVSRKPTDVRVCGMENRSRHVVHG